MNKKYDCISREEALSELRNLYEVKIGWQPYPPSIKSELRAFKHNCEDMIEDLPSITPAKEKVYVVTQNGWCDSFTNGEFINAKFTYLYLLGIFTDKNIAKNVAERYNAKVTEIEPNKMFSLTKFTVRVKE